MPPLSPEGYLGVGCENQVRLSLRRVDPGGKARKVTDLPLVVGFGLSEPEQVRDVAPLADGVVVGSALVRMIFELRVK